METKKGEVLVMTGFSQNTAKIHRWVRGKPKTVCGRKLHHIMEVDKSALEAFKACSNCRKT